MEITYNFQTKILMRISILASILIRISILIFLNKEVLFKEVQRFDED